MSPDERRSFAERIVLEVIAALPNDLRGHAEQLPVLLEDQPGPDLLHEGWDPDLLGLFTGEPWDYPAGDASVLPRSIRLFLENLWEFSAQDSVTFAEEVRTTYLHELGHFLGLEEDELEERGLL